MSPQRDPDLRARACCCDGGRERADAAEESSSEDAPFAGSTNKGPAPFAASPSAGFAAMGQWVLTHADHQRRRICVLPQGQPRRLALSLPSLDRLLHHQQRLARRHRRLPPFTGRDRDDGVRPRRARRLQPEHQRQPRLLADRRPLRQHRQHATTPRTRRPRSACSRRSSTIWCRTCSSASARRSRCRCRAAAATRTASISCSAAGCRTAL